MNSLFINNVNLFEINMLKLNSYVKDTNGSKHIIPNKCVSAKFLTGRRNELSHIGGDRFVTK